MPGYGRDKFQMPVLAMGSDSISVIGSPGKHPVGSARFTCILFKIKVYFVGEKRS